MVAFRVLMVVCFLWILAYTGVVVANHGFWLFPAFFGDLAALTWAGQFNADFMTFLVLSAVWLAWRHQFSPAGLALGVAGFFGGMLFLSAYLLWASLQAGGDVRELLLGKARAAATS